MATEPERPIEKLLQAYARKRRTEAGAAPELHPANRRILQTEVNRHFASRESRRGSLAELIGRWGPKFAWSVGLCAMLAVLGLLFLPGTHKQKEGGILLAGNGGAVKPEMFSAD